MVQNRASVISSHWEIELHKYLAGIIRCNGHKPLAINGMPDHVHILFGMRPVQSLSDLMRDVKGCSSKWINESNFVRGKFSWQEGYGAFSYSRSQLPRVVRYIQNQKEHHKAKNFMKEYKGFLEDFQIDYDEKYIFKTIDL